MGVVGVPGSTRGRRLDFGVTRTGLAATVGLLGVLSVVACSLGCANGTIPDPQQRLRDAEEIAAASGFTRLESRSASDDPLPVVGWVRHAPKNSNETTSLHVYIEGDGLAWRSRRRFSLDPTPVQAIGLQLAVADPSRATIVYLGRPCQYGFPPDSACRPIFWTAARYGEAVIDAMDRRVDGVVSEFGDQRPLSLIGYSGGGVVAALLAARRDDVALLVTIAAPLDIDGWSRSSHVSPLAASLSPMDSIAVLRDVRQRHFVGREDSRVPIAVTEAFHRALGPDAASLLTMIEDMDHLSWPGEWRKLIEATGLFE